MYLHLGQSLIIPTRDVIGIFDLDNASYALQTRRFLAEAEKRGQVIAVSEELPKSFVLCQTEGGDCAIYISQLSSATLLRRVEAGFSDIN